MKDQLPSFLLEKSRARVAERVRALRLERRWTQAELAQKLDMSQARLSEIERGGGSFSAEQLIVMLGLFNVSMDEFVPPQDPDDELQSALARLGAHHLREPRGVVAGARVGSIRSVFRETLLSPRSPRLLLALAPVLLANLEALSLDVLHEDLAAVGFPARVPWLVENVQAALSLNQPRSGRADTARWRRARVLLGDFISRHPAPHDLSLRRDMMDAGVRSEGALAKTLAAASEISRRWGVVTDIQPAHFAEAILEAHAAD